MSSKMLRAFGFLGKKKSSRPFKDFYGEWFKALKNEHLPHLRRAMASSTVSPVILAAQVEALHRHLLAYYEALDEAAADDVAQVLFPEWRNWLEKPFLWLGDLHPYLFTNLLRSFLDSDEEGESSTVGQPWYLATAWRSPPKTLMSRVDQIQCGLRLMVPALAARLRHAQAAFVERVGREWCEGGIIEECVAAQLEEVVGVVVDANRLRRSVVSDILNVTDVYQAALFLESLGQFLVGLRDEKWLAQLEKCKMPMNG
ncbi:unnamed protein product [Cuscuta europaea]|uniref:DOG1 domain-containing protein n=1 Tax=Cuscuta europaea TaxID=41803 RepID=A0A9P0ZXD6_CUSEU|nr:unnamed protein product [Cuscuta europaea]